MYDKYFSDKADEIIIIGLAGRDDILSTRAPRVYIENSQGEPLPVTSPMYHNVVSIAAAIVPNYRYYRTYVIVDRRVGKIYRFDRGCGGEPINVVVMGDLRSGCLSTPCSPDDLPDGYRFSDSMARGLVGVRIIRPDGAIGNQVKWVTDPEFISTLEKLNVKPFRDVPDLSYMFSVSEKDGITLRYVSKYLASTMPFPDVRNRVAVEIKDWWLANGKPSGEWTITVKPSGNMVEYAIMTDAVIPATLGWDYINDISK